MPSYLVIILGIEQDSLPDRSGAMPFVVEKWRWKLSELPIASLRDRIYTLMAQLPDHKVTTYGDLAALSGHPHAARIVGGIAHGGPENLPWHRLVNAKGGLAVGFPGGQGVQRQLLEQDGILLR